MSAPDQLVRSLARAFEDTGSTSKTVLKKVLQDHVQRLISAHPAANDAELDNFYTVAAWYLTKAYLLKQDCVSNQELAAEHLRIIENSRCIKAIATLNQVWGPKAVDRMRQDLRDPLPLPTVPARDFLEAIVKTATKVSFKVFLQHFPEFVSNKLPSWRTADQYFRQEAHPCLQFRHIDTFYKDWYVPQILQNGTTEPPSKRQKTSANRGNRSSARTQSVAQDDDIELPRRTSLSELREEETVIQDSSPAPHRSANSSTSIDSDIDNTVARDSGLQLDIDDTIAGDSGLQLDIGLTSIDGDLEQESSVNGHGLASKESTCPIDTASHNVNMAPRRGPPSGETRSERLVQGKYQSLQHNGSMENAFQAIKWIIQAAKDLEECKAKQAAAMEAWTTADNELQDLYKDLAQLVPTEKTLGEVISELEAGINRLETLTDRVVAMQQEIDREILPGFAACGFNSPENITSFEVDLTSIETAKKGKEGRLRELESLGASVEEKEKDLEEKEDEAKRLDEDYARLTTTLREVKDFMDLVPAESAAIAKLTLPSIEPELSWSLQALGDGGGCCIFFVDSQQADMVVYLRGRYHWQVLSQERVQRSSANTNHNDPKQFTPEPARPALLNSSAMDSALPLQRKLLLLHLCLELAAATFEIPKGTLHPSRPEKADGAAVASLLPAPSVLLFLFKQ
ncbi:hypothetical protein OPT61_g4977 [Boeremia exigua]|uniref:Uncharacterized protein n=1 Tax=Boeremia exigua TaxID=749465 RepID=A0ACC2IBY1_9PLEO|nr:hypothetical protein OPT61_g4977 [Boeremia exigua]